jgi:PAS domain-containing protein
LAEQAHHRLSLNEAARYLGISPEAVLAVAEAGYLAADGDGVALVDLKAFMARNADNGAGNLFELEPDAVDPEELLGELDIRADEMARRALEVFRAAFPEAASWTLSEQARWVEQAKARFEAILAVTGQGVAVDDALVGDLREVGASAAHAGSPLPQLLVTLRISRDLVVQTAVELAEERGRHWGLALSLVLTRVLPAMDRLTDALAQGYWSEIVSREEDAAARLRHVLQHTTDGVYEADTDGKLTSVNPGLAALVGLPESDLVGAPIAQVLASLGRRLDVSTYERRVAGQVVGFQGVVRDVRST